MRYVKLLRLGIIIIIMQPNLIIIMQYHLSDC